MTVQHCLSFDITVVHCAPYHSHQGKYPFVNWHCANMKVAVLHGKDVYELPCEQDETVQNLMEKIREASGVFERHQKLILKGKTLSAQATLAQAKVKDGARIMLMASSTPLQTQVSLKTLIASASALCGTSNTHTSKKGAASSYVLCMYTPRDNVLLQSSSDC